MVVCGLCQHLPDRLLRLAGFRALRILLQHGVFHCNGSGLLRVANLLVCEQEQQQFFMISLSGLFLSTIISVIFGGFRPAQSLLSPLLR